MQNDRPDAFLQVVLHALDSPDDVGPGALGQGSNAPILVDRSRPALAGAAD